VHEEAVKNDYYVKTESGSDYEGHCWPGTSSWIDFYNKKARDWYATLFKHDRYGGSTGDLWTWIDMNEPSVFNSHQVTMDRIASEYASMLPTPLSRTPASAELERPVPAPLPRGGAAARVAVREENVS
jgi:alpha-glucosidase (family GH31 glycosyl hydrolase)